MLFLWCEVFDVKTDRRYNHLCFLSLRIHGQRLCLWRGRGQDQNKGNRSALTNKQNWHPCKKLLWLIYCQIWSRLKIPECVINCRQYDISNDYKKMGNLLSESGPRGKNWGKLESFQVEKLADVKAINIKNLILEKVHRMMEFGII